MYVSHYDFIRSWSDLFSSRIDFIRSSSDFSRSLVNKLQITKAESNIDTEFLMAVAYEKLINIFGKR